MSKVILHVAQTVDGYISRKDGTVDYLTGFSDDMIQHFQDFISRIDVVVMGRTTYDEYNKYGWDMYKNQKIYVWTTRPHDPIDNIEFYTGSIEELIQKEEGKTIWCFGGTVLIKEFLKKSLIDVFEIATVPNLIGDGKLLFEPGDYELKLEHVETKVVGGTVMSNYIRVTSND